MHVVPQRVCTLKWYATTQGEHANRLKTITLNDDGRNPDGMLFNHDQLKVGTYKLVFDVAAISKPKACHYQSPTF